MRDLNVQDLNVQDLNAQDLDECRTSMTRHVFRQRSPLVLATVCAVTGIVLLLPLAGQWADDPQPLFVAWVILGLALAWALFVRPAVLIDEDGVTLRNVLRDIQIPWALVEDVECRWSLKVFVGDRGYSAWAISSQVERPKRASGGMFGNAFPGSLDKYASPRVKLPSPSVKVTASRVARSIEQGIEDYAVAANAAVPAVSDGPVPAVSDGRVPAVSDGRVRVAFAPVVLVSLLLPAIAVMVLTWI